MIRPVAMLCLCGAMAGCATQPASAPTLPPAPPPGEPQGIVGVAAPQLRASFGPPQFVRKDGGTELWRYDGQACKAFFFLYPQGSAMAVRHVETVPRGRDMAADTSCLDVLRARAGAVS